MNQEGPDLETLTRRLAETPDIFLRDPHLGSGKGLIQTPAVVGDLLRMLGCPFSQGELSPFHGVETTAERTRLTLIQVLCWLLADEWFRENAHHDKDRILALLKDDAGQLAGYGKAAKWISDPDRREELSRLTLARMGYLPKGETPEQAQDRLTTLSSIERARVMQAAKAAEQRAREIREALIRKAAEESADKWTRE